MSLYSSSKQEPESFWMILTVLSERSLASINLQRMLRSNAFSLQRIYVYICCTQAVLQPGRTSKINGTESAAKDPGVQRRCKATQIQAPADSLIASPRIQRNHQNMAEASCYFKKGLFSSVSPSSLQCRSCCPPFVAQVVGQPS